MDSNDLECERGIMCIDPVTDVYEGMIVGINSRDNDLVVNPCKINNLLMLEHQVKMMPLNYQNRNVLH